MDEFLKTCLISSLKVRPWATGAVKYHFYQNRSKQNEALCCWWIVIYFLKSKGVINTNLKIVVTGPEGIKELGAWDREEKLSSTLPITYI